jgi:hypothetical protein
MHIKDKNNVGLLLIIIGTIIFFLYGLPMFEKHQRQSRSKENFNPVTNNTTTTTNIMPKIDSNKCSTSCCGLNQWPVPNDIADPNMTSEELKKYIPSNFGCASGDYKGCVCLTQEESNYLTNRGQNN